MSKKLEIAVGIATIVGVVIAAIALIPSFGEWLLPREPSTNLAESTLESQTDIPVTIAPTRAVDRSKELLFEEDFEDGVANGFVTWGSLWRVVEDESDNNVYEIDSSNYSGWPTVNFGSDQWGNFTLSYRVRLEEFQSTDGSPMGYLDFSESFVFALKPYYDLFTLEYRDQGGAMTGISLVDSPVNKGTWYEVSVSVDGNRIQVSVDGELIISTTDLRVGHGFFSLGTAPNTVVQFDDIRITKH